MANKEKEEKPAKVRSPNPSSGSSHATIRRATVASFLLTVLLMLPRPGMVLRRLAYRPGAGQVHGRPSRAPRAA
eukprot:scaffold11739_cov129-Isochrysis_galbana.AAC.8